MSSLEYLPAELRGNSIWQKCLRAGASVAEVMYAAALGVQSREYLNGRELGVTHAEITQIFRLEPDRLREYFLFREISRLDHFQAQRIVKAHLNILPLHYKMALDYNLSYEDIIDVHSLMDLKGYLALRKLGLSHISILESPVIEQVGPHTYLAMCEVGIADSEMIEVLHLDVIPLHYVVMRELATHEQALQVIKVTSDPMTYVQHRRRGVDHVTILKRLLRLKHLYY